MKSFNDVVALITGGSSGIGLALARALGGEGARVAIAGSSSARIDAALAILRAEGLDAMGLVLDVADAHQWTRAVADAERNLGRIGFLALNAGVAPPPATVAATTLEVWQWSMGVNLWGVIHGLHTVLPSMQAGAQPGHVLITSSIAALNPQATMGAYAAAKAGVVALAQVLRAELAGTPIGVSVLAPAAVRTDIVARSQIHTPNANDEGYAQIAAALSSGLDPIRVAQYSLERIRAGAFYILTHDEQREDIEGKFSEIISAMQTHA
jgi:NAD(P)-dependent dehydrogenase (short-subunit alcohol dehydrogenase family)